MKGTVEKIDGQNVTINGKTKIFKRKEYAFKVGDYVEYSEKIGSRSNEFSSVKITEKIVEKVEKPKPTHSNIEVKPKESNNIKSKKTNSQEVNSKESDTPENKGVILPSLSFKDRIELGNLDKQTNDLFDKYIKSINLGKMTNSQLSTLENEAIRYSFNFNKLEKFIEKKLDKKRNVDFYESFKKDFLGKIEDKNDKKRNEKLFYLLKKYYRYSKAKKSPMELQTNEGDR